MTICGIVPIKAVPTIFVSDQIDKKNFMVELYITDPLRAANILVRKGMGHTAVLAAQASSLIL